MLKPSEIDYFLNNDLSNKEKRQAKIGQRYYEGKHDILNYKLYIPDKDGHYIEDTTRSNIKIPHPFFTELVDQEVQYMLSGDRPHVKSDIPELQELLDSYFDEDFDARFCCTKKEYAYYMYSSKINDPFLSKRAYRTTYPLDAEKMAEGAKFFVGTHDFASVRAVGTPVKSTVRTIFHCEVECVDNFKFAMQNDQTKLIQIRVCGDGFLYNMVRAISGTLMYVGSGKIKPEQIKDILKSCDRANAGPTLPAHGLYMNRLWYDDTNELKSYRLDI